METSKTFFTIVEKSGKKRKKIVANLIFYCFFFCRSTIKYNKENYENICFIE